MGIENESNTTTAESSVSDQKAALPDKKYQFEIEATEEVKAEAKPEVKTEDKKADTDDVRSGLASAAPAILGLLSRAKARAEEKKAEVEKAPEKSKVETTPQESPTPDDVRAEKLIGKKSKTPPKIEVADIDSDRLTTREIADAAARAAIGAVKEAKRSDPDPVPDYPDEYKSSSREYDYLAKKNPSRYGNIKSDLNAFDREEKKYRSVWESQNDGETFDPDSDDHAQFYAKHAPNISEADLDDADKALKAEDIKIAVDNEVNNQLEKRLAPLKAEKLREQVRPVAKHQSQKIARAAFAAVIPEIDIDNATPEEFKSIEEMAPKQAEVINNVAAHVSQIGSAYLDVVNQLTALDMRNPIHRDVVDVVSRVQSFILSRPRDERSRTTDNGGTQEFMPLEKFVTLNESQKSKYWTVGPTEVSSQLEIDASTIATKRWNHERATLEKYGVEIKPLTAKAKAQVRNPSPQSIPKTITQVVDDPRHKVSKSMSERGSAGQAPETVKLNPKGGLAALLSSLRPSSVSQK